MHHEHEFDGRDRHQRAPDDLHERSVQQLRHLLQRTVVELEEVAVVVQVSVSAAEPFDSARLLSCCFCCRTVRVVGPIEGGADVRTSFLAQTSSNN